MSARRSLLFSYLDRYASLIITFVASVVISRLLTPAEVGTFSVAMVLLGFIAPFRDFGASQYVIQIKELNDEVLRAVRGLQFSLGVLLAVIIAVSSTWVAHFYREPRIRDIMLLLALNTLLLPFGALSTALLNRELRFKALAVVRFVAALLGASTSIVMAWMGYGPISLAFGAMVATAVAALLAIYYRPVRLSWRSELGGVGRIFKFGGALTGTTLLGMLHTSVAELSLARLQGLAVSGLFSRAQGLVTMLERLLLDGAYAVLVPLFASEVRQDNPLGPHYIKAAGFVTALGWTFFGLFAVIAEPVIQLLYGDQWLQAVPIAQSLCISLILITPNLLFNHPLIAMGKAALVLRVAMVSTSLQACVVLAGANYSLEAACLAIIVASLLTTVPLMVISQRELAFQWRAMFKSLMQSATLSIVALLIPLILFIALGDRPDLGIVRIFISIVGCLAGLAIAAHLTRHPIADEIRRLLVSSKLLAPSGQK